MQFYPADWLQDTQILTLEAKGAWINLLCAMWVSPERGQITFTKRSLRVFLTNLEDEEIHQITVDLGNVADIKWRDRDGNIAITWDATTQITFISRRMVREEIERIKGLEADKRYRDKKAKGKRPKNVPKTSQIYQKTEDRSQKEEEPPTPLKGGTAIDFGFQRFWEEYPRKVNKPAALRAWKKEPAHFKDVQEKIMAVLPRHKQQDQWQKESGRFIPYPATWLNGRCWDDEVTIADDIYLQPGRSIEQILKDKERERWEARREAKQQAKQLEK